MTCQECDRIQDKTLNKKMPICYVRVGVGNMAIVGCEKHTKELINKLRKVN